MVKKIVACVGIKEIGKWKSYENGKHTWYYQAWRNMLNRCYSEAVHKRQPAYIGCTVSEEFKNFQYFAEWVHSQNLTEGVKYHLDKDILVKGNKEYSPINCRFVPVKINQLFTKANSLRGEYPIGVFLNKNNGTFRSEVAINGKRTRLSVSRTPEEAFYKYKKAKESEIKRLADLYKNDILPEVYQALYNYEVEITD